MGVSRIDKILETLIGQIRERSEVGISSQDITEGFKRPSFFVSFENIKRENHMSNAIETAGDIRISYFPTDKYKNQLELLNTQDLLSEIFLKDKKIFMENGSVMEVNEAEIEVVDKVLHFDFKVWLLELYERNIDSENMEEIVFREVSDDQ